MNEVQGTCSDGGLILSFSGRIDSNNAGQVQDYINKTIGDNQIDHIKINAEDLQYISSAGLRVLLRLRKRTEDLILFNVNPEVYEILDMTGFTEMIKVEKSYRQISVDGCEVIDEGSNGTLYRIDRDDVVKVYKNKDALADIRKEQDLARIALVLGIPTAISYDVVRVGDHYGSVFELLNARSFAEILKEEPEKTEWCVHEFAGMLSRIHSTLVEPGKLPEIKNTVLKWVEYLKDYLPEEYYKKLKHLVVQVPKDNHMIHGDYHIKNLLLQGDEVLLIDMDTLSVGHPVFELGSMYNAFVGFSEYDNKTVERFQGIDFDTSLKFWHRTLEEYLGTQDPEQVREVEDKARIVGYTRLIRRSIKRNGLEDEKGKAEIALWKEHLIELLDKVDSLVFYRSVLQIDAKEEKLDDVLDFINTHLNNAGCDPKIRQKINVAVEELFVNVALYAYHKVTGTVTVHIGINRLSDESSEAVITFSDSGIPFNPLSKEDPDISLGAQERSIGGLGIFMVKKIMDAVKYKREDSRNILTIKKKF